MSDAEDRTLAPSDRKLAQAREQGQAPVSKEVVTFASLGLVALTLMLTGPELSQALILHLRGMLTMTSSPDAALHQAAAAWAVMALPVLGAAALAGAGAVLLQTQFLLHGAALMPDLARLDPRRGLKRVFSLNNFVDTLKAVVKACVLAWTVWGAAAGIGPVLGASTAWLPMTLLAHIGQELLHVTFLVVGCQAVIAVLDVAWVRWQFTKRLQMSREDQKQEHREAEGDPKVKQRLRQLRTARSRQRMLAAVSRATVVITNPTHYAVALSYQRGGSSAPRVVAKGMDDVAARIREAATKAGVPLVANPPLARALHQLPLDTEVPSEHFKVVAEIIAYVWRLNGGRRGV